MDEIDVKRISRLGKVGLFPVRTVVISLQLNVGPRTQVALPTTEQITSRKLGILFHVGHKRCRVTRDPHALSGIAGVDVALKRQPVAIVYIPIRPEAGLTHAPVIELFLIGMKLRAPGESLPVYTVAKTFAVASAVAEIDKALIDISSAGGYECSMGLLSPFGDDIDHRVDGIRSPDRTAGASDDFDPFDILKQCVLDLPINACEQRRVHT